MFGLPAWLLVIPVLGFLIFIHELGHFLTAKWFNIKVTEFGFGFPPRIFGIRRGETIYSINWIPLGGFVKMVGEEDPATREGEFTVHVAPEYVNQSLSMRVRNQSGLTNHGSISASFQPDADGSNSTSFEQSGNLVPAPVYLSSDRPFSANFTIDSESESTYEIAMSEPGTLTIRLDSQDSGNGLDVAVAVSNPSPELQERLREAGLPTEFLNEDLTDPRSFAIQKVWKRAIVLSAGSFMNLLLPIIVFTVLFATPQDTVVGDVIINGVAPGSPAQEAGLRPGDVITAVNGTQLDNHAELIERVTAKLGDPIELTVRRGTPITGFTSSPEFSSQEILTVTPRLNPPEREVVEQVTDPGNQVSLTEARRYNAELQVGDTMQQGAIGILIGTSNPRVVKRSHSIFEAVPMAFQRMWDVITITKNGLSRWAAGGPDPGLTGPVGIARVTGEVARVGISPLFEFIALISISLGIVNILPIPALDGGRLMFVIIEWVRRGKRISPQREGIVHLVGFAVLIGLIVVISYFDVVRLLNGDSLIR